MPSAFGGPALNLTWDPTNRPMYNPGDIGKASGDVWQQIINSIIALIPGASDVIAFIKELTGIDLSTPDNLFGPLITAMGTPDPTLTSLQTFFQTSVVGLLNGISSFLGKGPEDTLDTIESWFNLPASSLSGQVPSDLLGFTPVGHVGAATTPKNLVQNPDFENLTELDSSVYTIDNSVSYTDKGGSARVSPDGTGAKDLLSNLIEVAQGQVLTCSGFSKWTTLLGSGTPIQLGLTAYLSGSAVSQPNLQSLGVTPTTTDWIGLSGTYTVPANVDSVRLRLTVAPSATAGTVWWDHLSVTKPAGVLPQNLIQSLEDDLASAASGLETALSQIATKVEQGDYEGLLTTLGGDLTAIGTRLASFLTPSSTLNGSNINTGSIADQFVPGLASNIDTIVRNLLNLNGSGYSSADQANALASQASALAGMAAEIASLKTTFTSGVSDGDDFERTSTTSLGTRWLVYYNTGSGIEATPNGHDASWIPNGVGDREFIAILNDGNIHSSTNLQVVGLALGSAGTRFYLPGIYNYCGHNDIWLRVSDDTTSLANVTGIRVRFGGDGSISITRFVAGIATTLASEPTGYITPPGPGSLLYGLAGTAGAARTFTAIVNKTPVLTIPEVGVASGLGAAFTRWGFGGRAEGHILPLPGQESPGRIWQITMADQ